MAVKSAFLEVTQNNRIWLGNRPDGKLSLGIKSSPFRLSSTYEVYIRDWSGHGDRNNPIRSYFTKFPDKHISPLAAIRIDVKEPLWDPGRDIYHLYFSIKCTGHEFYGFEIEFRVFEEVSRVDIEEDAKETKEN